MPAAIPLNECHCTFFFLQYLYRSFPHCFFFFFCRSLFLSLLVYMCIFRCDMVIFSIECEILDECSEHWHQSVHNSVYYLDLYSNQISYTIPFLLRELFLLSLSLFSLFTFCFNHDISSGLCCIDITTKTKKYVDYSYRCDWWKCVERSVIGIVFTGKLQFSTIFFVVRMLKPVAIFLMICCVEKNRLAKIATHVIWGEWTWKTDNRNVFKSPPSLWRFFS